MEAGSQFICLISENGKEEQWEKFIKGAGQKICLGINCGRMRKLDGKSIWIVRQNWNDFEEELTGYWEAEEQDGQYGYPNSPWNFLQSENYKTSLLIFDLVHVRLRFEHVFDAEITVRRFKDGNSFIVSAPWEKLGFFWMLHPVTTSKFKLVQYMVKSWNACKLNDSRPIRDAKLFRSLSWTCLS